MRVLTAETPCRGMVALRMTDTSTRNFRRTALLSIISVTPRKVLDIIYRVKKIKRETDASNRTRYLNSVTGGRK